MRRSISQITTAITTMVMIKLNAPRTLLTSSQLKGRDTPAKDTPAPSSRYARPATLARLRGSTSRAAPILRVVEGSGCTLPASTFASVFLETHTLW
jgi:hypothetical protein